MNIAFVLLSYQRDAPAGMERAVAGLLDGLVALGHHAVVLSAAPQAASDRDVVPIRSLAVGFPSDDGRLRAAIQQASGLEDEVDAILHDRAIDIVCYVDALWGIGRLLTRGPFRAVLTVHVVGHRIDLDAALGRRPDVVLAPAKRVLEQAAGRGYDTFGWKVVPNSLLDPRVPVPAPGVREALRRAGPIRVIARLGPEKGILPLLATVPPILGRTVEVALALAAFEADAGGQRRLLEDCQTAVAADSKIRLRPGLPWDGATEFLASAGIAVVPSRAETFGLVALEAMSVGTPVVAFSVGNLPDLVGDAGTLVPLAQGATGLWAAAQNLLADPLRYRAACQAGLARAEFYRPATVAQRWMEAVGP
ncbi:MAG: glycosyltransferase family 4 protein [Egibacteraceae bacterium]